MLLRSLIYDTAIGYWVPLPVKSASPTKYKHMQTSAGLRSIIIYYNCPAEI